MVKNIGKKLGGMVARTVVSNVVFTAVTGGTGPIVTAAVELYEKKKLL